MLTGRPTKYDQKVIDAICEEIATTNKSIKTICKNEDYPAAGTILRWLGEEDKQSFRDQYARAQEARADFLAEDILEISDDDKDDEKPFVGVNHIQRDRLKVDTRKWIASKLKPKKYGEKIDMAHSGEVNGFVINVGGKDLND